MTWFQDYGRHDLPWRESASAYEVLVSEFMLQQTTVATIIPRFRAWMKLFPTIEALANALEQEVLSAWQGLGYYARARRLHAVAKIIVIQYNGKIPSNLALLLQLPGIGAYTAAALQAFAFDQSVAVLDTNIFRVIARLNNITDPIDTLAGRKCIEEEMISLLPKKGGRDFAAALMDLGSIICIAGKPNCPKCPLANLCEAEEPSTLPRKKPKVATTKKTEARAFYQRGEFIYLEHSSGPLWKGLWILPMSPLIKRRQDVIISIVYPITRYRVTMNIYKPLGAVPKN
ncbi:MAG: A/G-specific adenine glycosylase, partial [Chthoniobacterales bacterium]